MVNRLPPEKQKKKEDINDLPIPPSLETVPENMLQPLSSPPPTPRTASNELAKQVKPPLTAVLPPPPPVFPKSLLNRPPIPESPPTSPLSDDQLFIKENITSEILEELRNSEFGSTFLEAVPEERRPPVEAMKEISKKYQNASNDYLAAGDKHLEMNFLTNAALNYSCAILCKFLGIDEFEASHLMAELAGKLPKTISESFSFQGTKLLLKANLIKNASFLFQAKKWLLKEAEYLYKEDKELIEHAISITMIKLGI